MIDVFQDKINELIDKKRMIVINRVLGMEFQAFKFHGDECVIRFFPSKDDIETLRCLDMDLEATREAFQAYKTKWNGFKTVWNGSPIEL